MEEKIVEKVAEEASEKMKSPQTEETPNPSAENLDKPTFLRINKQEEHLKNERAKIAEARRIFEADKAKAEKYSSLEGKNPFEILDHFGVTYEQLLKADHERRNPLDPNVKRALDRVQELETKIVTREEEAAKERRARAEIQIKADIQKTIKENDFDILETMDAEHSIIDYMEEIYNQTGEIADYKEACQAVMDSLVEQYHKISKSKWVQPKLGETPLKEALEKHDTLSNKMTQSTATVIKNKPLSEAERIKAAISALNAAESAKKRAI